jgi:hypothetical protein
MGESGTELYWMFFMMDKYYVKIASGSIAMQNHSEQHMIEVTTLDLAE